MPINIANMSEALIHSYAKKSIEFTINRFVRQRKIQASMGVIIPTILTQNFMSPSLANQCTLLIYKYSLEFEESIKSCMTKAVMFHSDMRQYLMKERHSDMHAISEFSSKVDGYRKLLIKEIALDIHLFVSKMKSDSIFSSVGLITASVAAFFAYLRLIW